MPFMRPNASFSSNDLRSTAIIISAIVISILCSCSISVLGIPIRPNVVRQEPLPSPSSLPSITPTFTPSLSLSSNPLSSISPTSSLTFSTAEVTPSLSATPTLPSQSLTGDINIPEPSSVIEEAASEGTPLPPTVSASQLSSLTPSLSSFPITTITPSSSPLPPPSNDDSSSEIVAQPAVSEESASSLVLPQAALIAISVGVAVAFIVALALIIFMVQRRGAARSESSEDDDNGGVNSSHESKGILPDVSSVGNTAATNALSPTTRANESVGIARNHIRGERALPPLNSSTTAAVTSVGALPSTSGRSDISSFPPSYVDASAPSPSQFTRRSSNASSDSSDTIVAPIYANDSVSTSAAAPWFIGNDSRLDT